MFRLSFYLTENENCLFIRMLIFVSEVFAYQINLLFKLYEFKS